MPFQRARNATAASSSREAAAGSVRFAIKLAWDGTSYQGFQAQSHGNTIQDNVEHRLRQLLRRQSLRIFGWGRTDRNVHARGAVVTVDLSREEIRRLVFERKGTPETTEEANRLAAKTILSALKDFPCDGGAGSITALAVVPVDHTFDPRFSSLWKRYVYFISSGSHGRSPFMGRYTWQIDQTLDLDRMMEAANLLSGRHDYSWLSVIQEGELRDPVRELHLTVERTDPGPFSFARETETVIKISAVCDFFLYRMMRRLVGALVSVGRRKASINQLQTCIQMFDDPSDQASTGEVPPVLKETAPAHGLCLDHIEYEFDIVIDTERGT